MASEAAASSEMLETTDIEELEVTETDVALLRELLEEESDKEELGKERVKQVVQALENELNANSDDDDKHDRLEQNEEVKVDGFDYYWPVMLEMRPTSPLVVETMAWYVDDKFGMAEFDCNIDYSQLYNGVFSEEETAYGCLWQF